MVKGSRVDGWAPPCELDEEMRTQKVLCYDVDAFDFTYAVAAYLTATSSSLLAGSEHLMPTSCRLDQLHKLECQLPQETAPQLQRAQVQARLSRAANNAEKAHARKAFKCSAEWTALCDLYRRFVRDWALPQFGFDLLYQATPVLRVVMPGSVPPCKPHCDADYFHDPNEINYWLPLTKTWASNTLWAESKPGLGDYAPFELQPGQVMRFYGNRCHHFTKVNETDSTRVSLDFRVLPRHLHVPPKDRDPKSSSVMTTSFMLDQGGYYELMHVDSVPRQTPRIVPHSGPHENVALENREEDITTK